MWGTIPNYKQDVKGSLKYGGITMLQIRNITRTILASMLAVTVAATFYPTTAFADTDYEAAYNQAKANTQAAYTEWQNALANVDTTYSAWQTAKTNYQTAYDQIAVKKTDMDKKHRILDYATRNAMDYLAQQAWNNDYGTSIAHSDWYYNTDARINALLSNTYGCGANANTEINYFKNNNVPAANYLKYGITKSATGTDDSNSADALTKYVYYNESYDMLMLTLDYFEETNILRSNSTNDPDFEGPATLLVSPYLMVQSAVNAPINRGHSIPDMSGANQCAQNLASYWGDVNAVKIGKYDSTSKDPLMGLFYGEQASRGNHYLNIIAKRTHAGMACSWTRTGRNFEQDFAITPNATGYSVSTYRSKINNLVGSELSAYNNAVTAYNNAVNTADDYADIRDDALDDYTDAQSLASQKETAYNNAVAAEQSAYDDYMNWLNNQNNNSNDGNETPSQPTVPEPTEPSVVTPSKVTGLTLTEITQSNQPAIKVTWNATTNASTYKLYQRKANGTWGFRTATNTSTTLTYLSKGTTYEVKVAGVSSDGTEGPVSDVKTLTTAAPSQPASTNPDPVEVDKVTGVSLKETNITSTGSHIVITWNKTSGASKYIVKYAVDAGGFGPADTYITTTSYTFTKAKPGKTYSFKVIPYGSDGTEGTTSDVVKITTTVDVPTTSDETSTPTSSAAGSTNPTTPPAPKPTVGASSITKMKVTKKSKKVDIWFSAAKNAKSYKVEIRRVYKLKGKKKIAVSSGWKAYNVSSPYKTTWKYKKKVSAKQAKKYQGKSNYLLKKSGKKYKLYQKTSVAPVTATKLTRKSIYQVRVTAINGSAKETSAVKTFKIK